MNSIIRRLKIQNPDLYHAIRDEALEEAALVAEERSGCFNWSSGGRPHSGAVDIAHEIRVKKSKKK